MDLTSVDTSTIVLPINQFRICRIILFICYFLLIIAANSFRQPSLVPLSSETHGGDDVGIFAIGPQAHMFQGVYEQNYIAHLMGYAACIGPGLKFCDARR